MINFYSKKAITITVKKPDGTTKVFDRAPVDCQITKSGGDVFSQATIDIYGIELKTGNDLSYTFDAFSRERYDITVQAGELGKQLPIVFVGEIMFSYIDLNNANPVLHIEAQTGCYPSLTKMSPKAYPNSTDVQSIISQLADDCGYTPDMANKFIGTIKDFFVNGDPISMLRTLAKAFHAFIFFDDGQVFMLPYGAVRNTGQAEPVIDKEHGMIGYPIMTKDGVNASMFFRSDLKLAEQVKISSDYVQTASAHWQLVQLTHTLSAFNPNNQAWRTDVVCAGLMQQKV